jgi:bifunctional non-homologous end joining protein LigD
VARASRAAAKPAEAGAEPLARYRAKRDFSLTPEPSGRVAEELAGHGYLIQKHAARRLHFDLRLELDGVLKSWAVPQGPSLDPGDRRLAVHVEDHPLEYGGFEGVIPKGQYGGGTVMLWDRGFWEPLGDAAKDYKKGKLKFRLHGRKLRGDWMLVRMGGKAKEEKQDLWLLIKERDEEATTEALPPGEDDRSVLTGRTMAEIADAKDRVWDGRQGEVEQERPTPSDELTPPPEFVAPQLATLADAAPAGQDWLHEIKHDGYRCQFRLDKGEVVIRTRNGHDWTHRFTALARAAALLPAGNALIDGEVAILDENGVSSFAKLKDALSEGGAGERMLFFAFDLLHQDGLDLREQPQLERKRRLEALLAGQTGAIRYSDHVIGGGEEVWRTAGRLGAEGIISKRVDAPYRSTRTTSWLKIKCYARQEFVIGGYTHLKGQKFGLGALLLGVYEGSDLVPVGKMGTGWNERQAKELLGRLEPLRADRMPFRSITTAAKRGAIWVRPELVAEVQFVGWTGDGNIRHASYQGLREDRDPKTVGREQAVAVTSAVGELPRVPAKEIRGDLVIGNIRISSAGRKILDDPPLTKGDVAHYYAAITDFILPEIAGRPVSLIRCPDRLDSGCFYQRHRAPGMPEAIRGIRIEGKDREPYVAIDDLDGLLSLIQFGGIELHPWGARADRPDRPDRLIFDLDPAPELPFSRVVAAAHELRERFVALKLQSFVKTTGGKGLHVILPIDRRYDWPTAKAFAGGIARAMEADSPKAYTATLSKKARTGRIFVDFLRNDRTSTAVAAYSLRGRPGAPVAMPIAWEEVTETLDPKRFSIMTAVGIAKGRADPWGELAKLRQRLPKAA